MQSQSDIISEMNQKFTQIVSELDEDPNHCRVMLTMFNQHPQIFRLRLLEFIDRIITVPDDTDKLLKTNLLKLLNHFFKEVKNGGDLANSVIKHLLEMS